LTLGSRQYPKHDSVFRVRPADAKQRTWFVFDHCLVLPEYLVEFEYVMKHSVAPDPPMSFMTELVEKVRQKSPDTAKRAREKNARNALVPQGVLQPQNETEANDMGPLARALVKFLYQCDLKATSGGGAGGAHDEVRAPCSVLLT
jgi:hypothetical protein